MSESENKPNGGFVFYPRAYHIIEESIDDSYAYGVNQNGEECVVHIRPTEGARAAAKNRDTAQTIPTLLEFGDESRRAKNPCIASEDNCKKKPEGVMIVEQTLQEGNMPESGPYPGLPIFIARWASVARESSDMPKVPVGPGYIEVGFSHKVDQHVNELMTQYQEIESQVANGIRTDMIEVEEEKTTLRQQIMAGRKKWFVSVMLRNEEIFPLANLEQETLKSALQGILNKYTMKGMYGGAIVRVREGDVVISEISASCNMMFDYQKKSVKPFEDTFNDFMKFNGNKILRTAKAQNYSIDIIPTIRINCGPVGMNKFADQFKGAGVPKVLKTFVDSDFHDKPFANYEREKGFLFAHMAVRLAVIGRGKSGAGNYLMSSVHAYSAPKGNILTLGNNGESIYKMNNAKKKEENAA